MPEIKYYVIYNVYFNPEKYLVGKKYIHIKGRHDGLYTAVMLRDILVNPDIIEYSQEELHLILDNWIDYENEHPEQSGIIQEYINIEQLKRLL